MNIYFFLSIVQSTKGTTIIFLLDVSPFHIKCSHKRKVSINIFMFLLEPLNQASGHWTIWVQLRTKYPFKFPKLQQSFPCKWPRFQNTWSHKRNFLINIFMFLQEPKIRVFVSGHCYLISFVNDIYAKTSVTHTKIMS